MRVTTTLSFQPNMMLKIQEESCKLDMTTSEYIRMCIREKWGWK